MKDKTVCVVGLGYVKLFCKQKPLLKKCLRHFLLRKKKYFFGKAFFLKERFDDKRIGTVQRELRIILDCLLMANKLAAVEEIVKNRSERRAENR